MIIYTTTLLQSAMLILQMALIHLYTKNATYPRKDFIHGLNPSADKQSRSNPAIILIPLSSFILGISLQSHLCIPTNYLCILSLGAILLTRSQKRLGNVVRYVSHVPLFILLGAITLAIQTISYYSQQKSLPKNQPITLVAKISKKEFNPNSYYKESLTTRPLFIQTTKDFNPSDECSFSGTILCYSPKKTPFLPGDIIRIDKITLVENKETKTISGNPTFHQYLIKENILATAFLKKTNITIIKKTNFFRRWLYRKKAKLFLSLKSKMSKKTFVYFSSIFLGNKKLNNPSADGSNQSKNHFYYWGIAHHLARSGLHIALFILIWMFSLSFLPIPFLTKHLLLFLLIAIYTFFSWTSISFIRAISIFLVYEIGQIFNKRVNSVHLLSSIIITILCFNPIRLFFLDFQLSFGLTMALVLVYGFNPSMHKTNHHR